MLVVNLQQQHGRELRASAAFFAARMPCPGLLLSTLC